MNRKELVNQITIATKKVSDLNLELGLLQLGVKLAATQEISDMISKETYPRKARLEEELKIELEKINNLYKQL